MRGFVSSPWEFALTFLSRAPCWHETLAGGAAAANSDGDDTVGAAVAPPAGLPGRPLHTDPLLTSRRPPDDGLERSRGPPLVALRGPSLQQLDSARDALLRGPEPEIHPDGVFPRASRARIRGSERHRAPRDALHRPSLCSHAHARRRPRSDGAPPGIVRHRRGRGRRRRGAEQRLTRTNRLHAHASASRDRPTRGAAERGGAKDRHTRTPRRHTA